MYLLSLPTCADFDKCAEVPGQSVEENNDEEEYKEEMLKHVKDKLIKKAASISESHRNVSSTLTKASRCCLFPIIISYNIMHE